MPWCDDCDRFYNPNTLDREGHCPSCGGVLHLPRDERRELAARQRRERRRARTSGGAAELARLEPAGEASAGTDAKERSVPWHFWVLVVALVIYLGYRLFQGILWVVHKL